MEFKNNYKQIKEKKIIEQYFFNNYYQPEIISISSENIPCIPISTIIIIIEDLNPLHGVFYTTDYYN